MRYFRSPAVAIFVAAGFALLRYIRVPAFRKAVRRHSLSRVALSAATAGASVSAAAPLPGVMFGAHQTALASARTLAGAILPDVSAALEIGVVSGLLFVIVLMAIFMHRLQKQKALLNALFEQTPQAIALTAADDRIILVNREFTRIFGYTPQAAVGRRLSELILPAESQDEHRKYADLVARGQRVDAADFLLCQDGSRVSAAITHAPFSAPGIKAAAYALYRNIGEHQTEARQTKEHFWRAIFDTTAVGIAVTDRNSRFIATNRAYREIVGYGEDELLGMSFMDLTCEEDRAKNATLLAELWAGQLPQFTLHKRYRRKDGRRIWVRVTSSSSPGAGAAPPFGMAVVEDITERKRAEERLREYERVVQGLQEMIVVVDRDYRYLIANQAFLNYRGLRAEDVVGHLVPELLGQETFERIIKSKMDECFAGRVVKYEQVVNYSALGERDILAAYFPIEGPAGVDRMAMVLEDITARKRADQELQRSFEALRALTAQLRNVREEERTGLARELHDQLGQALTAIRIDLATLRATAGGEERLQRIDAISGMVEETIHCVRRISTELRPGVLDDLGLVAAVEWAAEEYQKRTGIQCRLRAAERIPEIDAEGATALFRIVQETLTNIARHAGATQVSIALSEDAGHLSLDVLDNGRGISEEQVSAAGSLGILGMRERALLLGGEFFVGSPGSGTAVRVRIPCTNHRPPKAGQ